MLWQVLVYQPEERCHASSILEAGAKHLHPADMERVPLGGWPFFSPGMYRDEPSLYKLLNATSTPGTINSQPILVSRLHVTFDPPHAHTHTQVPMTTCYNTLEQVIYNKLQNYTYLPTYLPTYMHYCDSKLCTDASFPWSLAFICDCRAFWPQLRVPTVKRQAPLFWEFEPGTRALVF